MKNKRCLVIDSHGTHIEQALRLLRDCAQVTYTLIGDKICTLPGKIGEGLDGLEVADSPWGLIDKVDFILCPDAGSKEVVEYLKLHDYPVAGAGAIEKLETDRWWGRNVQKTNGLPVQETYKIVGVSALKDFCKAHKNYYVKVDDEYRGISESFKHLDYKVSEPRIDWIAYKTGPFKEDVVFICEELLEGIEPGMDGITFDGELLFPTLSGYERKKRGYVCRAYQNEGEYPDAFKRIHAGLQPEFKKNKTRFFYSTEMIIGKDRAPFLLDPTMRFASPGTCSVQCEMIDNYTEVIYGLATGQKVLPKMTYKYGAAIPLESMETNKVFVNVTFPKEMRQWIKLFVACKKGADYYVVPASEILADCILGCVVALGNTAKEAIDKALERAKEVKAECMTYDESGLEKILDDINEGKKSGIPF
jgi:hypothetical protein